MHRLRSGRYQVIVQEVTFEVRLISAAAFAAYMQHRGFTVRSLAARLGVKPGRIGHLRSGKRNTCPPQLARAIEKALDAPPGSLFVARLSTVHRERGRTAA
jgi:transcriptional regulator with XRE-family HTH domain